MHLAVEVALPRGQVPRALVQVAGRPWPGPLPADGGRREGERLLDAGADLVSLGRAFLANPTCPTGWPSGPR
ncbi:hypothetical protein [Nonomuraea sp. NPDC001831]|uniref:hypothetical protein n=1 Tax=Nonomuraea sp. NPDC001831 TaxID=3364340 RepID=UPI0036A2AB36